MGTPATPPTALFLGELIDSQRRAVRFYLVFASLLFLLGILVFAAALRHQSSLIPEALKSAFSLGGGFVSALSGFPLKEMLNRQEKISIFRAMQTRIAVLEKSHDSIDQKERHRLDDILWQAIERTALS